MSGKTGKPVMASGSVWRAIAVAVMGIVLLSGTAPVWGETVCFEGEYSTDADTGGSRLLISPLRPEDDPVQQLQRLQAEFDSRLARQKSALLENYNQQCGTYLQQEKQRCVQQSQQLETEQAEEKAGLTGRLRQCEAGLKSVSDERDRLQALVAETAPHPGTAALEAYPDGPVSFGITVLGIAAAVAGFLAGLSGQAGNRLQMGSLAAILTLSFFVLALILLPDTRPTDLLFALTSSLLLTVAYFYALEVAPPGLSLPSFPWRRRASAPPATPAPPAPQEPRRRRVRPARARRTAPAPSESADIEGLLDGYTRAPLEEVARQQQLFRCLGCGRFYGEASLEAMKRETGGSCYAHGCGSTDFREYHLPPSA